MHCSNLDLLLIILKMHIMFIKQPFSEKRLLICSKVKWGFGNPMASFDQRKQTILIVQDKNNPHKNSFAVSQCGNSSSFHTHQNQCKARNSPRERQQCCDRHFIVFCYFFPCCPNPRCRRYVLINSEAPIILRKNNKRKLQPELPSRSGSSIC